MKVVQNEVVLLYNSKLKWKSFCFKFIEFEFDSHGLELISRVLSPCEPSLRIAHHIELKFDSCLSNLIELEYDSLSVYRSSNMSKFKFVSIWIHPDDENIKRLLLTYNLHIVVI